MKDRYMNGFIAGLCGGMSGSAFNLICTNLLHFGSLKFADFASVILFGHLPKGFSEVILAYFAYLGYASTLGIIFAYLILHLSPHYFYFKSLHFGIAVWFASYAITVLFRVPYLFKISVATVFVNLIASLIYGLILGLVLKRLEKSSQARSQLLAKGGV